MADDKSQLVEKLRQRAQERAAPAAKPLRNEAPARPGQAPTATGAAAPAAATPTTPAETPRELVLRVAAQLFAREGFAKVSLDHVADAAGVSHAVIAQACISREDLFFQVLKSQMAELVKEAQRVVEGKASVGAMLRELSETAFRFLDSHPLLLQLMLGLLSDDLPGWEDRMRELQYRCIAVLETALKRSIDEGILRNDLPLDMMAQLLLEVHVSGFLWYHRPGPDRELRAALRRRVALDVLINGLRRQR